MWWQIFYWDINIGQADLPDTPNMVLKSTENVLEVFEKIVNSKHEEETNVKSEVGIFGQKLVFWAEKIFKCL